MNPAPQTRATGPGINLDRRTSIIRHGVNRARVLVVDDLEANVRFLTHFLQTKGIRDVHGVTDPKAVAAMYRELRPDLVLLDLDMPEMDGFSVMSQLTEVEAGSYAPVLVMTAINAPDVRVRALEAGARDFIAKPFDHVEAYARIRNMIEVRQLHEEVLAHRSRLDRFVNPATRRISRISSDAGKGMLVERAVLFSDLRGFTRFAEGRSPEQVFQVLENALEMQAEEIEREDGEVDKFMGDGVMAAFADAGQAFRTALAIRQRTVAFFASHGLAPHAPGVGIHFGEVMEGVIGRQFLRSYTLIGDTVNVAARLCEAARAGQVTVSDALYERLGERERGLLADSGNRPLEGRSTVTRVWITAPHTRVSHNEPTEEPDISERDTEVIVRRF